MAIRLRPTISATRRPSGPPRRWRRQGVAPAMRRQTEGKVLLLPGFLNESEVYVEMAQNLKAKGYDTEILEISKREWYPTLLGKTFEWYVERLGEKIDALYDTCEDLTLVAHSAGGWIARICLGHTPYMGLPCCRLHKVKKLITLGTPHLSLENYPFGRFNENVFSQEGPEAESRTWSSSLQFVNEIYADASKLRPVQITTIVGSGFRGQTLGPLKRLSYLFSQGSVPVAASISDFADASYKANCGRSDVDGDGVCPIQTALLPGAQHVVLPDIYHGPNRYRLDWYGSKAGISQWHVHLETEIQSATNS